MISLAHCAAHVSAAPVVSQPAGGAAARSLANSCSECALPAACIARTTAVLAQSECRFEAGGTAGAGATSKIKLPAIVIATVSPIPNVGDVPPTFGSTLVWQVLSKYFAPTCSG